MDLNDVGGALSSALGAVGNVLDAPRRLVYGGLVNPAYHALGGDPNRQIGHFADLLGAAGMDQNDWLTKGLGMAGDVATDPLTYAGAFGGEALANAGLRSGEAIAQVGRGAESLGAGSEMRNLLSPVTTFKDVAPAAADAIPEAFDRAAGQVGSDAAGMTGRVVGGRQYLPGQIEGKFDASLAGLGDTQGRLGASGGVVAGSYTPSTSSVLLPEGAGPLAARHEHVHAIINQAARSGEMDGLPAAMRIPAQLQAAGGMDPATFAGGLGTIGDELAAQSLENRGIANQLRGGANFLFHTPVNDAYSALYAQGGVNPLARGAYRAMRYVPAAAGAAVGGASGLLASALSE